MSNHWYAIRAREADKKASLEKEKERKALKARDTKARQQAERKRKKLEAEAKRLRRLR